ncbi:hypothetical protein DFH08DRAFT_899856 [Mycena albidolilacea]|uniref:DUF6534 domain-containing protein n=1 Tax=Mycena albidolilacea TaxID=1033008 RepID=A0AAD7EBP4_9AGAR|nr:hypothetical protein DFH08DRAFT_899856 [Mycena albidolilacea]
MATALSPPPAVIRRLVVFYLGGWIQNVEYFMNLNAALGMFTTSWFTELNMTFIALIAFYVQLFFCKRLWGISKNIYIVTLVVALFVFALVAAIVSSVFQFAVFQFAGQSKNITWSKEAVEISGSTVFAGDVLLCGSTIYFLSYHSKHALPDTASMLSSLTKLTFQSAAPAVVCALISLVSTVAWDHNNPDIYTMLALIADNVLPKLYAISAMWTLNSRRKIRRPHSSTGRNGSATTSGGRLTNGIELTWPWMSGDLSTEAHVPAEVEMTQLTERVSSPKSDRPYH